jgi:pimeloyl-ACP methyl ester carboxylesterase
MSNAVKAEHEVPVFIAAGGEDLFGIWTNPTNREKGDALVLLTGGDIPSMSRNRMNVSIARRVAATGMHAFRFDWHGIGDSTGSLERIRLEEPMVEDLAEVIRAVRARGLSQVVLWGSCGGARAALAYAEQTPEVVGMILISCPLRDGQLYEGFEEQPVGQIVTYYKKRLSIGSAVHGLMTRSTRRRFLFVLKRKLKAARGRLFTRERGRKGELSWVSPSFLETFEHTMDAKVPMLLIYGTEDSFYDDFEAAKNGEFGALLERAGSRVEVQCLPTTLHGFPSLESQEMVIDASLEWLVRLPAKRAGRD